MWVPAACSTSAAAAPSGLTKHTLLNEGTIEWQEPNGSFHLQSSTIDNHGLFDILADHGFALDDSNSAFENRVGATLRKSSAGATYFNLPLNNCGLVDVKSGTLRFTSTFKQTAGTVDLAGGDIAFDSHGELERGIICGSGTITGSLSNSGGILSPGHSAGTISIIGDYTQSTEGVLLMEIAGLAPGQYDILHVQGNAALNGTLQISLLNGFQPAIGDEFHILDFGSRSGECAARH